MTIYLLHIPVGQSVAANILFVPAVGFWQSNCMIRPGTSLTWAFVSPWPSSTRPCLPSHNMTFGAQIVWPFRRLDCLAHTDKTDKTVSQITAPSSIIRLLWTECSPLCACLSSPSDKQGSTQCSYNTAVDLLLDFVTVSVRVWRSTSSQVSVRLSNHNIRASRHWQAKPLLGTVNVFGFWISCWSNRCAWGYHKGVTLKSLDDGVYWTKKTKRVRNGLNCLSALTHRTLQTYFS